MEYCTAPSKCIMISLEFLLFFLCCHCNGETYKARCNMPQKVGITTGDHNGIFVSPGTFIVFVNGPGPGPVSISEEQKKNW